MSIPEAVERERLLVEGLVGPHRDLYHHSASFRAALKMLAQMLPPMIDGLAADAERREEQRQEMLAMMVDPRTPVRWDLMGLDAAGRPERQS